MESSISMERVNHISGIQQTVLFLSYLKFKSRISFSHSWGNLHRQHRVDQRQSANDASRGPKDTATTVVVHCFRQKGAKGWDNETHFTLVLKHNKRKGKSWREESLHLHTDKEDFLNDTSTSQLKFPALQVPLGFPCTDIERCPIHSQSKQDDSTLYSLNVRTPCADATHYHKRALLSVDLMPIREAVLLPGKELFWLHNFYLHYQNFATVNN